MTCMIYPVFMQFTIILYLDPHLSTSAAGSTEDDESKDNALCTFKHIKYMHNIVHITPDKHIHIGNIK